MKALLLAAGLGSRLRPITDSTPKCLVLINGKPLLEYWLEALTLLGVESIAINTHYLADKVAEYIESSEYSNLVELIYESELMGTAGTLKNNLDYWGNDDLLVAHADNLCLCSFNDFVTAFNSRPNSCLGTMMTFDTDSPSTCGIVDEDENGLVVGFYEKVEYPPSNNANAAVFIFSPAVKMFISELKVHENDISLYLIPKLLSRINVWKNNGYMRDIGTQESLNQANRDLTYIK